MLSLEQRDARFSTAGGGELISSELVFFFEVDLPFKLGERS